MQLTVDIKKDKALDALRKFPAEMGKNLRLATKASIRDIKTEAIQTHRYTPRSGNLDRSISDEVAASGLAGKVFLDTGVAKYGPFIHEGTKPHTIAAVSKKVLRFVLGGAFRFARAIRHPGTRPDKFLHQAGRKLEPKITKRYNDAIAKTIVQGGLK